MVTETEGDMWRVEEVCDVMARGSASTTSVTILIADDHEVARRGVRAILESQPGWVVCGEASTGRDAIEQARQLRPDVVILDIGMPELNGLDAARRIRKEVPHAEVLILTMHDSEQVIREVLDAGARGYVLKSDAGRDLVAAVEALRIHKPFFSSRVNELVLTRYLQGDSAGAPPRSPLTPREREVMQLLAEGNSNKVVATILGISIKTAETHRTNILRKLDLHSMSEVVRYAIRNNLIDP